MQGTRQLVDGLQVTNTQRTIIHTQKSIESQEDTPHAVEDRELADAAQVQSFRELCEALVCALLRPLGDLSGFRNVLVDQLAIAGFFVERGAME